MLALLDYLDTGLNIDRKRVYASGFSAGGWFCHYLAGRTEGVWAAIAPVSGLIGLGRVPGEPIEYVPPPAEPLPVMIVNGLKDTSVPYFGGTTASCAPVSSVAEAVKQWITANYCASLPVTTTNGVAPSRVITDIYGNCDPGTEVILHTVENGPHLWYDANDVFNGAPVGFDANKMVIDFLKQHARP